ncbi:MAG TPA: dihydrolipoamide acetyltransferase family protein, partial [Balneolaceae bacterium]|nr:dihydrolipoamide acetyltransferase family protein [Balneolaceae bacterium]
MAVKVEMPKLSDTQEEGVLAKWNVEEGDKVESGDVVAEVETDKATMDVEVFDSGTILKILVDEGTTVPLGGLMAVIGEEGEDISDILEEAKNGGTDAEEQEAAEAEGTEKEQAAEKEEGKEEKSSADKKQKEESKADKSPSPSAKNGRIKASPLARNMAKEQGIELSNVEGSGPQGRIIKRDIESYEPSKAPSFESTSREDKEVRVSQMRKTIARRLSESKFGSPHYYETIDIDAARLIEGRARLNETIEGKISFNDIIVKACSVALRKHPMVNSSWQEDTILQHGDVNVAVAVAI